MILVLLLSTPALPALAQVTVAVYNDEGAWSDGITAFEKFLDWKGLTHQRVSAADINTTALDGTYKVVYFPGGYAYDYKRKLTARGEQHIRDFVNNGGAYIGICAGAFFAADRVDWEGGSYPYTLGLFKGTARGALDVITPWPGWAMTSITMRPDHPITAGRRSSYTTLYYGGPSFHPASGTLIDTLATWDADAGSPAIITLTYGSGRVLLIGPHPEIEENDTRDGTAFASDLTDPESEWGMLWTSMDWLLQRPISDTTVTTIEAVAEPTTPEVITVFPNPAVASATVTLTQRVTTTGRLSLVDALGRECMVLHDGPVLQGPAHFRVSLRKPDGTALPAGVYHVVFRVGDGVRTARVVVGRW